MNERDLTDDIYTRYPGGRGNARATALLCALARKLNRHQDAMALGLAAVAAAPQDMEVRDIVRAALSGDVPVFHAPMLHDQARNLAYARAIERHVLPGMTVLEIGTGAGLLALLAARAGARVVTCEANPMIAAAAREIAHRNGLSDRIEVIAKQSDAIEIGVDLAEPADLLLHEIFGDTLFGEGVVGSLTDARARLLKPAAPILPPRAELRCALVERTTPRTDLAMVEGFDLSPFDLLSSPAGYTANARSRRALPRSEPQSALRLDFMAPPPFGAESETIALTSTGGRIDAIAQWLRIDFGDGDVLENDPFTGTPSHWGAPLFDLVAPIETKPGEVISVALRRVASRLTVKVELQA